MEMKLIRLILLYMACILLSGCATPPPLADSPISLPMTFEKIWYRPTLEMSGFFVMTDTGTVTVKTNGIAFAGKTESREISYEKIQKISFGGVGSDFINNWVTIKYRDGEADLYALFSGGKVFGFGGGGDAARIFQTIRLALSQKGLDSVVEKQ